MFKSVLSFSALAALALTVGCATAKKETDQALATPSAETQTAAREVHASHVTEVTFDKNSFVLTEGSRAALMQMVNQAKTTGAIDDVKVIAYSDKSYPANSKIKIPKKERDLASKRADAITNYLKSELSISDVDTFNMAERPNIFETTFNTADARMKSALENAGVTSNAGKSIAGKTSKAVVMVMLK